MDQTQRRNREMTGDKPAAPKEWDARTNPDAMPLGGREDDPVYKDPVTGTTPLDALEPTAATGPSKSGPGNWGVAARWFVFAILAVLFIWALYAFL